MSSSDKKTELLAVLSNRLLYKLSTQPVWPFEGSASVSLWVENCVELGFDKDYCINAALNAFSVEKIKCSDIPPGEVFFFEGGLYHFEKKKFFYRKISEEMFDHPDKFGFIRPHDTLFHSSANKELCGFVKDEFSKLFNEKYAYSKPAHIELRANVVSIKSGRISQPVQFIDFTQIGSLNGEYLDSNILNLMWASPVRKIVDHIKNARAGNALFLSGDYAKKSAPMLSEEFFMMMGEEVCKLRTKTSSDRVQLLDIDEIDAEELKKAFFLLRKKGCFIVFVSESRNITELLFKIEGVITKRDLVGSWGVHYFRSLLPSLCDSCKEKVDKGGSFSEETLSLSETFPSEYRAGLGCNHCVGGYRGTSIVSEDFEQRDVFIGTLLDSYKTFESEDESNEELSDKDKSPFSVASKHYNQKDAPTLATSIITLLSHGKIQVKDANGILV